MIFVGDDWAEQHHDIEIHDEHGRRLARRRLPEGVQGVAQLHALLAEHACDPGEVVVGIETDRGLWVASLIAAGYTVFALNPKVVARYRERHAIAGAKSDTADAKLLADIVRVDRHNHRSVAGDSDLVEAVKIVARAHRRLVWTRQRQQNTLRAALRQFYPAALEAFGNELAHPDAVAVLAAAPTPAQGRRLTLARLESLLRKGGRRRGVTARASSLRDALHSQQLTPAALLEAAHGVEVAAIAAILAAMNTQLATLEAELTTRFNEHPDAHIVHSQPGLGPLVGARVLGEFGDDHQRYADAKARKRYAGTAPITVASGKKIVVRARLRSNRHLADACYWWAFCALTQSPGARALYDTRRAKGDSHDQALRALGNRLVGILHGCLRNHSPYDEATAWPANTTAD